MIVENHAADGVYHAADLHEASSTLSTHVVTTQACARQQLHGICSRAILLGARHLLRRAKGRVGLRHERAAQRHSDSAGLQDLQPRCS